MRNEISFFAKRYHSKKLGPVLELLVGFCIQSLKFIYTYDYWDPDEKDFRPYPVRTSSIMLDPDTFVISAAKLKTYDRVLATLSLKNILFGAPIKDQGYRWGSGRRDW